MEAQYIWDEFLNPLPVSSWKPQRRSSSETPLKPSGELGELPLEDPFQLQVGQDLGESRVPVWLLALPFSLSP